MKKKDLTLSIKLAAVAAIYVVLTIAFPLSYGPFQFRISELLILLCFYRKEYSVSLILGCMIANFFSPYGIVDVFFGTLATVLSVAMICLIKNIYVASLFPTLFNGIIVGLEICLYENLTPFWESFGSIALSVMFGEFVVVSVVGILVFKLLEKNQYIMDVIGAKRDPLIEE